MTRTGTTPPAPSGWGERIVAGWRRFLASSGVKALITLIDFFLNGHFILATGKWVALVGARTAVTVLFFASLWVAGESTVHPFMVKVVSHLLPFLTTGTLDNLALTAFTWLPEIIVLEAILKTVFFAIDIIKGEKRVWSAIWGTIYLPLTGIFVYIAISTFMSYISMHASDPQANTGMLIFRALMAWIYSIIEMAYPAIYRRMYAEEAPTHAVVTPPAPATPAVDVEAVVKQALAEQEARQQEQLRQVAEMQRQALEQMTQRHEQHANLQRIEMQRLLAQVQQPSDVAPLSPEQVVELVMQRVEALFEATMQPRVTVASAETNALSPGGRTDTTGKQRAIRGRTRLVALPQAEASAGENKTRQIFELLDKDPTLQPVELARLVGCDRSMAWRVHQRWQVARSATVDSAEQEEREDQDGSLLQEREDAEQPDGEQEAM